ncbi:hypothetical protein [Sphingobacterium pedocola]|uniref:Uncharacterized protein n=1 Tax=Sphingobacterium pedocola TaxID=2082722 RepID=A0ABR9T757_9SPHI|nr:hypothetical protein [Sphingobacterium pedocola]MBE8720822.1 hypothetical protein [Sphingobacterium pedocola]
MLCRFSVFVEWDINISGEEHDKGFQFDEDVLTGFNFGVTYSSKYSCLGYTSIFKSNSLLSLLFKVLLLKASM